MNGVLTRNYNKEELIKLLEKNIHLDFEEPKVKSHIISSIMRKKNENKKI